MRQDDGVTPDALVRLHGWIQSFPASDPKDLEILAEVKSGKPDYLDWRPAAHRMLFGLMSNRAGEPSPSELHLNFDPAAKGNVFVEGVTGSVIKPPAPATFFGSRCSPDVVIVPGRIAIEVDHGHLGAHLRTALAKAEFNVSFGGYSRCYVLFFDQSDAGSLMREALSPAEQAVIQGFERRQTYLVRFRDRTRSEYRARGLRTDADSAPEERHASDAHGGVDAAASTTTTAPR